MPCFTRCVKEELEEKLSPIVEKIILKFLEERFPKDKEDVVIEIKDWVHVMWKLLHECIAELLGLELDKDETPTLPEKEDEPWTAARA